MRTPARVPCVGLKVGPFSDPQTAWYSRFDHDRDGWLSRPELVCMLAEMGWRSEVCVPIPKFALL